MSTNKTLEMTLQAAALAMREGAQMTAFGHLIDAIHQLQPNPIREARQVLIDEFNKDPSFRQTYVDNIACVIMDYEKSLQEPESNHVPLTHEHRNELASRILQHILG